MQLTEILNAFWLIFISKFIITSIVFEMVNV